MYAMQLKPCVAASPRPHGGAPELTIPKQAGSSAIIMIACDMQYMQVCMQETNPAVKRKQADGWPHVFVQLSQLPHHRCTNTNTAQYIQHMR